MEEQFKKGIMMPPMPEPVEEMPMETPEHPNAKILEHTMMNQDAKSTETNTLLEHILSNQDEKLTTTNTLLEHNLMKLDENGQRPEVQKVKIVTDPSEVADNFFRMLRGQKGEKGDKGDSIKGDKGDQGIQGIQGEKGDKGDKGDSIVGERGPQGFKGEQGDVGPQGPDGKRGPKGERGKDAETLAQDIDDLAQKINEKIVYEKIQGAPRYKINGSLARATEFRELTDTPNTYTGQSGKVVKVKATEDGLEFGVGGAGGGHTIQDEGVDLTQRTNLNFVGAGVTVTDDAGNDATIVTIPSGGGSGVVEEVVAGTGISVDSTDPANPIVTSTITQYTDEMAQDAVGNAVGNGLDYDDATGAISVDESELSLPFLKLDQTSSQTIANGQPIQGTLTASELVSTDANRKLQSLAVATYPSLTELSYVKGVTSAVQTQLGNKVPTSTTVAGKALSGNITIALDDLSDVVCSAPNADDGLFYDGANWVCRAGVIGAGNGITEYLTDTDSPDVTDAKYVVLSRTPLTTVETSFNAAVTSGTSPVEIKSFIMSSTGIGVTTIPAGVWKFDIYAKNSGGTTAGFDIVVYAATVSGGNVTLGSALFTTTNQPVTNAINNYQITSVQPAFTGLTAAHRLVFLFRATQSVSTSRTINIYIGGSVHASHATTPLQTRHNDLAGLNVGDYKHLTAAEYASLGSGSSTQKTITQASHGFAVNDAIKFAGSTYQKAQADSAANAEVVGVVTAVNGNDFTFTMEGFATVGTLTADTVYFLSAGTAGLLTATEPTTIGQISKPVLKTIGTTTAIINNMRGMEITAATADTYLPLAGGTMTGDLLGAVSHGSTGTRITKLWATDIESTNAPTVGGVAVPTISSTNTLTNKDVVKRVVTVNAPGATPTTVIANADIYEFTGLATAITSMTTNLDNTGAYNGQMKEFIFLDDGTAQGITWGASFVDSGNVTLPATTVISTALRVLVQYQTMASLNKWVCVAKA